MLFFAQDLLYFYGTIYGGLFIGLLFDINRCLKSNFKFIEKFSFVFDIIFWIISTIVMFLTINTMEFFELRYYHFVALFLGFILYYGMISKFILSILNIVVGTIKNTITFLIGYITTIIENIYYVVIYTIHFIMDIILSILGINFFRKKVFSKKNRS